MEHNKKEDFKQDPTEQYFWKNIDESIIQIEWLKSKKWAYHQWKLSRNNVWTIKKPKDVISLNGNEH